MTACICRPGDPEGWYREDCPVHGREAQEELAESARRMNDPRAEVAGVADMDMRR